MSEDRIEHLAESRIDYLNDKRNTLEQFRVPETIQPAFEALLEFDPNNREESELMCDTLNDLKERIERSEIESGIINLGSLESRLEVLSELSVGERLSNMPESIRESARGAAESVINVAVDSRGELTPVKLGITAGLSYGLYKIGSGLLNLIPNNREAPDPEHDNSFSKGARFVGESLYKIAKISGAIYVASLIVNGAHRAYEWYTTPSSESSESSIEDAETTAEESTPETEVEEDAADEETELEARLAELNNSDVPTIALNDTSLEGINVLDLTKPISIDGKDVLFRTNGLGELVLIIDGHPRIYEYTWDNGRKDKVELTTDNFIRRNNNEHGSHFSQSDSGAYLDSDIINFIQNCDTTSPTTLDTPDLVNFNVLNPMGPISISGKDVLFELNDSNELVLIIDGESHIYTNDQSKRVIIQENRLLFGIGIGYGEYFADYIGVPIRKNDLINFINSLGIDSAETTSTTT
ncbi:hypothetical protein HN512_03270 [Candidatus Peregrinibacteria bacterium]|jgi:hypothetical protein|nr:hypothetical protein [Candidatus Peregrinibacteria bacterium]MBT3598833.1 hypothetical protein [Candidatus Peregrinibacteria bacterium]MBT4366911.1 hypothetical protein [Candidatus Peregrinibacteria bacterium]MBT4585411.1 hypothetical protein [Candidatus Peregrinibacteria bacterium]MBT6731157.1 hypothetical protein [Candidatus Peregrinibacteria bacterium]